MQLNKTCQLVEQYLGYLIVIKGRSENTILEYRTDLLMFFNFVLDSRNIFINNSNFSIVNLDFIKSINLNDIYDLLLIVKQSEGLLLEQEQRTTVSAVF